MSKTISQINLGTEIYLRENGEPVPYILIKKDAVGCVLLRAVADAGHRMNPTNTAVYETSEMDSYLNDDESGFMSRFDASTKSAIVARSIPTYSFGDSECHYISRKCYLLSFGELFSNAVSAVEPEKNIAGVLALWKGTQDINAARIALNASGSAVNWWLRSPNSAAYFYYVYGNGSSFTNNAALTNSVRPALNVAPATIVSDEVDDKIYLSPSLAETHAVEFKGKVVESARRPTKAVANYNATNLSNISVKVCNNYGDVEPVWVDATAQTEIIFTNQTKETESYEIGIWCYGESTGYGYFEEPRVIFMEV